VVLYADTYNDGIIPQHVSGRLLTLLMTEQISFEGYSGPIEFSQGRPEILQYGEGDREIGVRFAVSNFHPGNGTFSSAALRRVGTWSGNSTMEVSLVDGLRSGFKLCGNDATLQSEITGDIYTHIRVYTCADI
jgi:hypothetical protein